MHNSVVRIAAILFFVFAMLVVSFSSFQTAKILKENMCQMVRRNADLKQTFGIIKKMVSGEREKGDFDMLAKSVFGLSSMSSYSKGRENIPDLSL